MSKLGDAAPAHFAKVIEAIDKMIATLGEQETTDLKNKESCEKARVDDTREAITISRAVDELSETVMRLKAEIEELQAQIEEKKEEIKETQEMLKEAKQNREDDISPVAVRVARLFVGYSAEKGRAYGLGERTTRVPFALAPCDC